MPCDNLYPSLTWPASGGIVGRRDSVHCGEKSARRNIAEGDGKGEPIPDPRSTVCMPNESPVGAHGGGSTTSSQVNVHRTRNSSVVIGEVDVLTTVGSYTLLVADVICGICD
jgi:hypothetical protein